MKRFLAGLVVGIVVASVPVAFAEDMIHLVVNGQEVVFPEAPPQIINGYTMVPARPLAEALGATVGWDDATRTVIVTEKMAEVPPESEPPVPPPPQTIPLVFERDGALFVEWNHLYATLSNRHGTDKVMYSGFKWTVNGSMFTLTSVRENGVRYLDAMPIVEAGLISDTDFN